VGRWLPYKIAYKKTVSAIILKGGNIAWK